jgi:hypothetical protein
MSQIKGVTSLADGWVTLHVEDISGETHYMDVKEIDLHAYEDGELIQNCFPYLSIEQRETIISGMTQDMWDKIFGNNEQ